MYHFIEPEEIHWVEAAGNYVELHLGGKEGECETYMLRSTMKEIEKRLDNKDFARIHRSTRVNRSQINSIVVAQGGDKKLTLSSHIEAFSISRNYRHNLRV